MNILKTIAYLIVAFFKLFTLKRHIEMKIHKLKDELEKIKNEMAVCNDQNRFDWLSARRLQLNKEIAILSSQLK